MRGINRKILGNASETKLTFEIKIITVINERNEVLISSVRMKINKIALLYFYLLLNFTVV